MKAAHQSTPHPLVAREEFPTGYYQCAAQYPLEGGLLDPLAELVKIDPKSIG